MYSRELHIMLEQWQKFYLIAKNAMVMYEVRMSGMCTDESKSMSGRACAAPTSYPPSAQIGDFQPHSHFSSW